MSRGIKTNRDSICPNKFYRTNKTLFQPKNRSNSETRLNKGKAGLNKKYGKSKLHSMPGKEYEIYLKLQIGILLQTLYANILHWLIKKAVTSRI